jgi:hypothetical protein
VRTGEKGIYTISHQKPAMLGSLLDNFETVWDINSRKDGIVDLLQKVVNATSMSLIII